MALSTITGGLWLLCVVEGEATGTLPWIQGRDWGNRVWAFERGIGIQLYGPGRAPVPDGPVSDEWMAERRKNWHQFGLLGFVYFHGDNVVYGAYGPAPTGRWIKWYETVHFGLVVPYWIILLPLLIAPFLWFRNHRRRVIAETSS